jgi:hypothetical protein
MILDRLQGFPHADVDWPLTDIASAKIQERNRKDPGSFAIEFASAFPPESLTCSARIVPKTYEGQAARQDYVRVNVRVRTRAPANLLFNVPIFVKDLFLGCLPPAGCRS